MASKYDVHAQDWIDLYENQGLTTTEIARRYGLSETVGKNAVGRMLKRHGVSLTRHTNSFPYDEWIRLYVEEGWSTRRIGDHYGTDLSNVYRVLQRRGVEFRSVSEAVSKHLEEFPREVRPLAERFGEKVDRRGDDECWPWTAAANPAGYGLIAVGDGTGSMKQATHAALEIAGRPAPSEGLYACHTCDNPVCVNPAHLFWDDHSGNMADMVQKGRSNAVLSAADREAVRELYATRLDLTQAALGERFGVHQTVISRVVRSTH